MEMLRNDPENDRKEETEQFRLLKNPLPGLVFIRSDVPVKAACICRPG